MPRISAQTLAEHHDRMWSALVDALETCLAEKSYDKITLTDVAAAAGIARNTIYNYARDKDALIVAATDFSARSLIGMVNAIAAQADRPSDRLSALVGAILNWVSTGGNRALLGHALIGGPSATPADSELFITITGAMGKIVTEGVARGEFRRECQLTLELMAGTIQAAVRRAYDNPEDLGAVQDEAVRLLLAGLEP